MSLNSCHSGSGAGSVVFELAGGAAREGGVADCWSRVVDNRTPPVGGRRFCLLTRGLEVFSLRLTIPSGALGGCAEEGCATELDRPVGGATGSEEAMAKRVLGVKMGVAVRMSR